MVIAFLDLPFDGRRNERLSGVGGGLLTPNSERRRMTRSPMLEIGQ